MTANRLRASILLAMALSAQAATAAELPEAAKILVDKSDRRMELLDENGRLVKAYTIALGGDPVGHKAQEGDEKTPEGLYKISERNSKSSSHLSLRISYPNQEDREQAARRNVSPGGDIMIHGIRNGFGWVGAFHQWMDWTDGCIAVTNHEIEEIWDLVPNGTPIEIRP